MRSWTKKTEITQAQILSWLGLWSSTFSKWTRSYGKAYEHNGWIPRDHWLEDWEKQAIIKFYFDHPLNGYRRLTYMMLDANIVAVSATSVYRVLSEAGLLRRRNTGPSKKGTGFTQPLTAHEHWHLDIAYLNICGTFYFIASLLDGFSRSVVHWEIREKMEERDIQAITQRAREKYPDAKPRIITDNGPQFIAKDFKEFIRICGMTHVRTSPFYPQSNGKLERYHRTLKSECIRPKTPLNLEDARRVVAGFVTEYNEGDSTARSAISRHMTCWAADKQRFMSSAMRSSKRRAPSARRLANSSVAGAMRISSVTNLPCRRLRVILRTFGRRIRLCWEAT